MAEIYAFIQARSDSTRLPGKVFKRIPNSNSSPTITEHIYNRLLKVLAPEKIVYLIPEGDTNLVNFLSLKKILFMEGPKEDVRQRYIQASKLFNCDAILRLTGDNPFIDLEHIELLLEAWFLKKPDLVSFSGLPLGMGAELFSISALMQEPQEGLQDRHKEHVSLHIKEEPKRYNIFKIPSVLSANTSIQVEKIRMTLDEITDYQTLSDVYSHLQQTPFFGAREVIQLYEQKKEIFQTNSNVKQITFPLPQKDRSEEKKVFILHAPVHIHGSGHFERCKLIKVFLELNDYRCTLSEIPSKDNFDFYIIDYRDSTVPTGINRKKTILLDNLGPDRTNGPSADYLFNPSYDIQSFLLAPSLDEYLLQPEEDYLLVYAGNIGEKESIKLDRILSEYNIKVVRIGGKPPSQKNSEYFSRVSRFEFYHLLGKSKAFMTYAGNSLQESIYLKKKIILYSISEIHHKLALHIANQAGLVYSGNLLSGSLTMPSLESVVASKIRLPNNGLKEILNQIKCIDT